MYTNKAFLFDGLFMNDFGMYKNDEKFISYA